MIIIRIDGNKPAGWITFNEIAEVLPVLKQMGLHGVIDALARLSSKLPTISGVYELAGGYWLIRDDNRVNAIKL